MTVRAFIIWTAGIIIIAVSYFFIGWSARPTPTTERHLPVTMQREIHDAYRYAAHCGGTVSVEPLNDGTAQEHRIGNHDVVVIGCDQ